MKTMDFKLVKNKDGYFNLSINRRPSITMVDLEKDDLIALRDILDETIKNAMLACTKRANELGGK